MATNCLIGVQPEDGDGSVEAIYCHYDGYPTMVGAILKARIRTEDEARDLINGGDISYLQGEDEDGNLDPLYYQYYIGKPWEKIKPETFEDVSAFLEEAGNYSYAYLYANGGWEGYTGGGDVVHIPPDENRYNKSPNWGAQDIRPQARVSAGPITGPEPDVSTDQGDQ